MHLYVCIDTFDCGSESPPFSLSVFLLLRVLYTIGHNALKGLICRPGMAFARTFKACKRGQVNPSTQFRDELGGVSVHESSNDETDETKFGDA